MGSGRAHPGTPQRAIAGNADAARSVVPSPCPDPAGASSSAGPAPSAANPQVIAQSNAEAASPPAAAAVTLAAADAAPAGPSGSIQQLLVAIAGALALAGLIASAVFRFGGPRRLRRRDVRANRGVDWDSVRTNRPSLAAEARAADDDRIAQMLARLARSAAN